MAVPLGKLRRLTPSLGIRYDDVGDDTAVDCRTGSGSSSRAGIKLEKALPMPRRSPAISLAFTRESIPTLYLRKLGVQTLSDRRTMNGYGCYGQVLLDFKSKL
jgi:hypothetical protein